MNTTPPAALLAVALHNLGLSASATCGAVYGDSFGQAVCNLAPNHAGAHEAPTGDDDGVWSWAR